METSVRSRVARREHRFIPWIIGIVGLLIAGLYIASFFLDDIVRARTQSAMNAKLKGYQVTISRAHLQLVGGRLTLTRVRIVQLAYPRPPIADLPRTEFHIELKEVLYGRVVTELLFSHPKIHIDRTQLAAERSSPVPLKQKGWQEAVQSIYPFKINRLTIKEGDIAYIEDSKSTSLNVTKLNLITDNICNIHTPNNVYPSPIHASLVVFGAGQATLDGQANYLEEPFPGGRMRFSVKNVPLSAFDPEIRRINIAVGGGQLSSEGLVEYSPKIAKVEVHKATIDTVHVAYVHAAPTAEGEAQRAKETGKKVAQQNNRPAVYIKLHELNVVQSDFSFANEAANPKYRLFMQRADITLRNLSNHQQDGTSSLTIRGKFMGSADTDVMGTFLASQQGPAFDMNIAIRNTSLPSMNDLLRAYGRFDVAAGKLSVFSEVHIRDGQINGYVKPMFANVEVYNYQKDKNTSVLHQTKEMLIGGATRLFKNSSTQQVATEVNLEGKLTRPDVSTWQAIVEVLRNAFIQAILPGFDRAIGPRASAKSNKLK